MKVNINHNKKILENLKMSQIKLVYNKKIHLPSSCRRILKDIQPDINNIQQLKKKKKNQLNPINTVIIIKIFYFQQKNLSVKEGQSHKS